MPNRNFGKLIDGVITYAPTEIRIGNTYHPAPTDEQYLAAGWKRISDHMPPSRDGGYWEPTGWEEGDTIIERIYEWRETPVTVGDYDAAMEEHITQERVKRGYTTREPSAYINSPNPRFAQDAADWGVFLADVMAFGLDVLNEYEQTCVAPMTLAEFRAGLPKCKWTITDDPKTEEA